MPQGRYMKVGSEIGWLGFPAIAAKDLCFFSGQVSATQVDRNRYLVDGVVIHGVSGGPAFSVYGIDEPSAGPTVIGLATAYMPNRTLRVWGDLRPMSIGVTVGDWVGHQSGVY